ncbi:MAG TPA: hypothetical protein VGC96_08785 [Candidatus Elarobacter sp.]|jgi:hypothetical protein
MTFRNAAACLASIAAVGVVHAASFAEPRITVEHAPAIVVVTRDVAGDYDQAPRVFGDLMRVAKPYRTAGNVFGIYPVDPDATTGANELRWQAAIQVVETANPGATPALGDLAKPEQPYRLELLSASTVAVVKSTVARAGADGLAVIPWMARNGYVQIAPTRMEFLRADVPSSQIPVRIVVPIAKRKSGLKAG